MKPPIFPILLLLAIPGFCAPEPTLTEPSSLTPSEATSLPNHDPGINLNLNLNLNLKRSLATLSPSPHSISTQIPPSALAELLVPAHRSA
ncbi:uncharacterized protein BP01DRAFT_379784 [Aspergillus saccharolyticus JOP 1030-1]|uniref:Uncharacterized protein n=1 Tax=Aspergillus saccharolyticus JOP 1030-1 TaxID=1450539 RepID=A0A318ZPP2_9EURO|nr:hypothetical protein BP01DRAFT_379784 [Aspergillus saccharolyticus JOP 1030-1]PYH48605.1 hypothetical protein BP01DRAFT_379784 [Aspergillus saccharolyticus JOP 1030-1]